MFGGIFCIDTSIEPPFLKGQLKCVLVNYGLAIRTCFEARVMDQSLLAAINLMVLIFKSRLSRTIINKWS
jgi:hypothetical protein